MADNFLANSRLDTLNEQLKIIESEPQNQNALCEIAKISNSIGNHEQALIHANKAFSIDPTNTKAIAQMSEAFAYMGRIDKAIICYKQALKINENDIITIEGLQKLIKNSVRLGYNAAQLLKQFDDITKNNFKLLAFFGTILIDVEDYEGALEYLQRSDKLNGKFLTNLINLSIVHNFLGNFEKAEKVARKALKISPNNADAITSIATMKKFKSVKDKDIEIINKSLEDKNNTPTQNSKLYFALGKIYNDCKEYEKAFSTFEIANKKHYEIIKDNKTISYIDFITKTNKEFVFDKEFVKKTEGFGTKLDKAIFIIGCPRSGSTLVEQILSSHPQIGSTGENTHSFFETASLISKKYGSSYPDCLKKMSEEDSILFGDKYIESITNLALNDADYLINKTLDNFCHLGLIKLIMPNAKVINCYRHPLDVCLSIYFHSLENMVGNFYQLEAIGEYYKKYTQILKKWNELYPDFIHNIYYESIVSNKEPVIKNLLKSCDIKWNDKCLNHEKNKRAIKTSSSWQARKPVYTSSVNRWKNYEKFIPDLIEQLKDEVEDYEKRLSDDSNRYNNP